ncbi:AAA family ATPase [Siccibacter colletis]|uniref:AAA family ATPase n=1 Tax=Siccibacter colletis TaxID=1505757 RepID=UPI0004E231BE|nr:AAA family ATPase [Siccibacter colletis]
MSGKKVEFEGLTGVGKVQLDLEPDQQVYTFIGANGVGKTKTLEALFQLYFFSHELISGLDKSVNGSILRASSFSTDRLSIIFSDKRKNWPAVRHIYQGDYRHSVPCLFLGAQVRGAIKHNNSTYVQIMGALRQRREGYLTSILETMEDNFGAMNMDVNIEEWFITQARSANPYQKQDDNREVELKTVLRLLHEIDDRIDPEFLEISGDERVSFKIENDKRELSQLSSGFASILKLIQAIVSGYGYFTNETQLQKVKGIVLIDEIESHLHLSWQANIIPLLKRLFPNTTFYITTHSSVVLSQLKEGEAYNLYRNDEGVVKSQKIPAPNKAALADILKNVFNVDLNQMKLENNSVIEQQDAKKSLLALLRKQEDKQ